MSADTVTILSVLPQTVESKCLDGTGPIGPLFPETAGSASPRQVPRAHASLEHSSLWWFGLFQGDECKPPPDKGLHFLWPFCTPRASGQTLSPRQRQTIPFL